MANGSATMLGGGSIRWAAAGHGAVQSDCAPCTKQYGPDPSCQPCPDCGGLECLCRPRFFAGQLLTEQDLNRLDHYIVEKHKLHNRHLWGPGVVCGLVVTCAPCDERVNVSAGYALSPCGEDIVVCKPDSVDICALIARCRKPDGPDCAPFGSTDGGCEDVLEDWVLALRYAEYPSRPQTPLVGTSSCSCGTAAKGSGCSGGCGCSGGSGCGCSSGSAQASGTPAQSAATMPRLRRGGSPTCEPTVVCESYRYDVFRAPEPTDNDDPGSRGDNAGSDLGGVLVGSLAGLFDNLEGEMAQRIACCLRELDKALPKAPGDFDTMTDADRQAWFRWCCAVRSSLIGYFSRAGGTDCEEIEKLSSVVCPDPNLPLAQFKSTLTASILAVFEPTLQAMMHCICMNILPPCPPPGDPRVPLAVVTVRKRDCHIVKVCNWTPLREHVVTFPTLGYWFGWIPIQRIIRDFMEQLCCQIFSFDFGDRQTGATSNVDGANVADFDGGLPLNENAAQPATEAYMEQPVSMNWQPAAKGNAMLTNALFASILAPAETRATLTRGDLFDLAFRRPAFLTPDGLDTADEARLTGRIAESGMVKSLAAVIRGAARGAPSVLAGSGGIAASMLRRPAETSAAPAPEPASAAAPDLAEMKRSLDSQAKEIAALRARLDEPPPAAAKKAPAAAAEARSGRAAAKTKPAARPTGKPRNRKS